MPPIDLPRRNFLRTSSFGLAAAGFPAAGLASQLYHSEGEAPNRTGFTGTAGIFDVRNFGAKGDGKTLDTDAINRAIDQAFASGGGTVLFPAGSYLTFSIHLKSNVHLLLQQGSIILAADSPKSGDKTGYNGGTYDAAEPNDPWEPYQDYGHNHWHNSLIWGENLHDISITGPGLVWGRGLSNGRNPKGNVVFFVAEQAGVGNKAIALKNCRNVTLADFSILKGGHFGLLLTGVDNLIIDGLTIDTDRDGMDIDCCQNVRVSNCAVNSPWDDGICPKSSYALGYARPTRNLTITNCYVTGQYQLGTLLDGTFKKFAPEEHVSRTGRIKFGTESNGGFINTTVSNCVFEGCQGLALETVDGALFEDIAITNITMRDLSACPIFLRLGARLRGPKESTKVGTLRRVLISNLECHNAPSRNGSLLVGIPGYAIEDVKLSNIFIESAGGAPAESVQINPAENETKYPEPNMFGATPSHGFFLRHVKHLEMSHVELATIAPDPRPAFYLEDVDRADFFAITAPKPSGPGAAAGNFAMRQAKDLRIGWSRAAADFTSSSFDGIL
ncbi:glycoside hydrolase family 28 protein [Acidicapsa dinghuensis]|uniref:Glycoside hydrolase family 28 protein n=1 Tax=Acidicapsa dinghuensis TaxID=2218256 RepID=A0ABW1EL00_9BACT|nr:glycoside hydrolase family 28 protein [Acidicapsa dinghuensis]